MQPPFLMEAVPAGSPACRERLGGCSQTSPPASQHARTGVLGITSPSRQLQGEAGAHPTQGAGDTSRCPWQGPSGMGGGTGPLYLETVISVWGPCAFSRPSLVKMPTSTMTATTPQMM